VRAVTIQYHYLESAASPDSHPFPEQCIRDYYHYVEIEISFKAGRRIELSEWASRPELIKTCRAIDPRAGHIVMGGIYEGSQPNAKSISGDMIDSASRGVAAIFTKSKRLRTYDRDTLTQTIVHEIGHLFNLGHEGTGYPTAMHPPGLRTGTAPDAWQEMWEEDETVPNTFHLGPPPKLICYPLSLLARTRLRYLADEEFKPWGSQFNPPVHDAFA
jgi:hypothetical protein